MLPSRLTSSWWMGNTEAQAGRELPAEFVQLSGKGRANLRSQPFLSRACIFHPYADLGSPTAEAWPEAIHPTSLCFG